VILNVPSGFLSLPIDLNFKHWIVIREIDGSFYNLDSKLQKPEAIGKTIDVVYYLLERILHKKTQMLLVVDQETDENGSWYKAGNHANQDGGNIAAQNSADNTQNDASNSEEKAARDS